MKRILFLLIVALSTLAILLFLFNPEVLDKVWLWMVGLAGLIVALIKQGIDWIKQLAPSDDKTKPEGQGPRGNKQEADNSVKSIWKQEKSLLNQRIEELEKQLLKVDNTELFEGTTITMLRYLDDGETTLGLLFYNGSFLCYTLEDTFRETKLGSRARIPKGTYRIGFKQSLTELTSTYRQIYPWFEFHLELKDVPGYDNVYIHIGNNNQNTEGCILIVDGIGAGNDQQMLNNSQQAYKRFYLKLKQVLDKEEKVRISILDEQWFASISKHSDALLIN